MVQLIVTVFICALLMIVGSAEGDADGAFGACILVIVVSLLIWGITLLESPGVM